MIACWTLSREKKGQRLPDSTPPLLNFSYHTVMIRVTGNLINIPQKSFFSIHLQSIEIFYCKYCRYILPVNQSINI